MKILIVEDDEIIRVMLKYFLNNIDSTYIILNTATVPEAITIIKEQEIDLLFLDYYLGGDLKGTDLIEIVRKLPGKSQIPAIILLTAATDYTYQEIEIKIKLYEKVKLARKPITSTHLIALIKELK